MACIVWSVAKGNILLNVCWPGNDLPAYVSLLFSELKFVIQDVRQDQRSKLFNRLVFGIISFFFRFARMILCCIVYNIVFVASFIGHLSHSDFHILLRCAAFNSNG